jgi:hypothetical protein
MTDAAIFRATFVSNGRLNRERGMVPITLEVPQSEADATIKMLGGLKAAGSDAWLYFAVVAPDVGEKAMAAPPAPAQRATARQSESTPPKRTLSQRAYLLCADKAYWKFLQEQGYEPTDSNDARDAMREICDVGSRKEFDIFGGAAQRRFLAHESAFLRWSGRVPQERSA